MEEIIAGLLLAQTQQSYTAAVAWLTKAADTPKARRRSGRPPSGVRAGEKVKEYPQLSIRLPLESKATLSALSLVGARPQWRVVTDAIDCYLRERPRTEQRTVMERVREMLGHRRRRSGG